MAKRKLPIQRCISYHKKKAKKKLKVPKKGETHLNAMAESYCRIYQIAKCMRDDGMPDLYSHGCASIHSTLNRFTRANNALMTMITL